MQFTTELPVQSFWIPGYRKSELVGRIEKINKTCRKRGYPEFTLTLSEDTRTLPTSRMERDVLWTPVPGFNVELTGQYPVIEGFRVIGRVEYTRERTVIVHSFGAFTVPQQYHTYPDVSCDHCGVNRFRKLSYVLQSVILDEYKLVGSTCLDYYVEDLSYFSALSHVACIDELAEYDPEQARSCGFVYHNRDDLLRMAYRSIKAYGYQKTESEYSTRSSTEYLLRSGAAAADFDRDYPFTEAQKAEFVQFLTWLNALTWNANDSEYMRNIATLAGMSTIDARHTGLACSIPHVWLKQWAAVSGASSHYVGKVGEKVTVVATLDRKEQVANYYGGAQSWKLRFVVDDGAVLTCITTSKPVVACSIGDTLTLTAIVKAHKTFSGSKCTLVKSPKVAPYAAAA